jgi:ELWxxDGT repeat protein
VGAGSGLAALGLPNPVALDATTFLFAADDGTGAELWRSDGTFAGTVMVKDIRAGGGSDPRDLVNVGGTVYFSANDGVTGRELWRTDGTSAGTTRITDLATGDSLGTSSFLPAQIVGLNGTIFFAATDGTTGFELWRTDGTTGGTQRVKDIRVGSMGSSPNSLTAVNDWLYFSADDGTHGYELWTSDGTEAGTVRLSDIGSGTSDGLGVGPELAKLDGKLLFAAASSGSDYELWGLSLCGDGTTDPPDETCDSGAQNGADNCCLTTCAVVDGDGDLTCDASDNCSAAANPDQRNSDELAEAAPRKGDVCDPCPADPADACSAPMTGCALIGSTGGTVNTTSGASLTFPAGALSNTCNDAARTPCTTVADCQAIGATSCGPNSVCITGQSAVKHCVGSSNPGTVCSVDAQCPGGTCVVNFGVGNLGTNLVGGVADLDPNGATFAQDVTLTFPWLDVNNNGMVESRTTGADTTVDELFLRVWRNGKQAGTCGNSPQTLCTSDLPCPSGGFCNLKRCAEALPPCGTSALCCDTATNRWTVKVRSFSGYSLGVDCAPIDDPRLRITRLGPPAGDDRLTFTGMLTLPDGLTLADVNPLVEGLSLILNDAAGTLLGVTLPAGAFDPDTRTGWKVNLPGTRWTYTNRSATPPGGIFKARVLDKSTLGPGLVKVVLKGKDGDYPATAAAAVSVVLPENGDCFAASFPTCTSNPEGSTLKCRAP